MTSDFIQIYIERTSKTPLFRQVYEKIRDEILTGNLKPGIKLPSTRRLAKDLDVSRNVVMEAYDQLHAEGYTDSSQGSYTRVAEDTHYLKYQHPDKEKKPSVKKTIPYEIGFQTGTPDLNLFPKILWGNYLKKAVMQAKNSELTYYQPEGHYDLRYVLSKYLYRVKGLSVVPEQIVITSGATQALSLAAGVVYKDNCKAVIEEPGGYGVIQIFKNAGYGLSTAETGNKGILPSSIKLTPQTTLIYTTPSHQFPMGSILTAASRIELLRLIEGQDIFIVEDDYDSEFRYDGPPIHPIKALDPDKVIYIGSFSKVLSPALRIGYTVLPLSLIDSFKKSKQFSDAQSPMIDQIALKNFIQDGQFEKHVYKMRKVYKRKRDALINVLFDEFGDSIRIYGEKTGLHIVVRFKDITLHYNQKFEVIHNGVYIHSVEKHTLKKGHYADHLIFGYGNLSEDEIVTGIRRLNKFR